jgi:DHA1 family 2-module integral membrane pump EmrD-like MFS transporter
MMYFLGGLSNRIYHVRLPSAEQRLRIGARVMAGASVVMLLLSLTVGLTIWTLAAPVLVMGFCAGAMYPTLMAKGNSLFPHIAGLTAAILGCALLLVSSVMMALAGFVSVQILAPLALFFVILAFTVVAMVTLLLRHLEQSQATRTMRGGADAA